MGQGPNKGWQPAAHADDVIEAATALATFVATSPGLARRDAVRREVLRLYVLMLVTQGTLPKKGATRYMSAGALKASAGDRMEHEHVYTRSYLADLILANPNAGPIRWILTNLAVAATVTKAEHEALTRIKGVEGWERYRAAGVEVVDLVTGEAVTASPDLPDWLLVPGGDRRPVRLPSDALSRLLASDSMRALLDPDLTEIEAFADWETRRAEAFEVIETVAQMAGQGFPSREAAREALFPQVNGFGVRLWLQDAVLAMLHE